MGTSGEQKPENQAITMIFWKLFYTFLIIGAFTFGGGYSMVALIQDQVVTHHGWLTAQEFTDILAISQMTPGPIGINTATYAGYTAVANAGYPAWLAAAGSLLASLAVVAVPVALMLLVCRYLSRYMDHPRVAAMLRVLRLTVVGLIAAAALSLLTAESFGQTGLNRQFIVSLTIFAAIFVATLRRKASPLTLLALSGLAGWVAYGL